MIDLDAVIQDLLHSHDDEETPAQWRSRSSRRLGPGLVRLEYDQDDSIFIVRVERVPVHRPAGGVPVAVGTIDGLTVRLTGVTVEEQLIVRLDIADSPHRQALEAAFHEEFEAWVRHGRDSDEMPPRTPGERLFGVDVEVRDDLGTEYSSNAGNASSRAYAGGTGTEWLGGRYITPAPPPGVHRITVRLRVGGGDPVDVDVPLL